MPGARRVLLVLLAAASLAAPAAAYTYTSWHECSAQAVYGGIYGAEVLGNLSDFKSGLLSQVWQSFDPAVPYAEVRLLLIGLVAPLILRRCSSSSVVYA